MRERTYIEATRDALVHEMEHNSRIFVIGQDVGEYGGVFQTTNGLRDRFGALRVRDAPVCHRGLIAFCVGASLAGAVPVIDLTFVDYLLYAAGDLAHQVANVPRLSGGRFTVPLVIRACVGVGLSAGPFHSGNYHAWFAHLPGLHVVAPSSPREGQNLLRSALRSEQPVIVLEHKALLETRGLVPEDDEVVAAIDRALVVQEGSAITIAAYGAVLARAVAAARELVAEGISAEVIDIRSLAPLDLETLVASVAKTGRLLLVDDCFGPHSIAAEIAAQMAAHALDYLDAPIERLTARHEPAPYSPSLETSYAPASEDIIHAARKMAQM